MIQGYEDGEPYFCSVHRISHMLSLGGDLRPSEMGHIRD